MNDDSLQSAGKRLLDSFGNLVNDRFVGREGMLSRLTDILNYPRTGKPMPTIVLRGPAGSGKSWLAYRFMQEIAERRIPVVTLDTRAGVARLPGGFGYIARDIANRFDLQTPRFDRVHEIYARRYLGIEIPHKEVESSLFQDIIRSFRKEPEVEDIEPLGIRRIYGPNWQGVLSAKPIYENISAMAIALSEDIESALPRKKYPFIALIIDNWDTEWDLFLPHWDKLFKSSSRLLTVITTDGETRFTDSVEFPVTMFNDVEARSALRRRGIEANHAVAGIIAESMGHPTAISLAAALAELISRSGDIIREGTFKLPENERFFGYFGMNIVERLRESEREALYAISHAGGIDAIGLTKLFPEDPDLADDLISLISSIPIDPIFREDSPIRLHSSLYRYIEPFVEAPHLPGNRDLAKRAVELTREDERDRFEVSSLNMLSVVDSESAMAHAFERIVHYNQTGQIGFSEDMWRASRPDESKHGLCAIHRDIGEFMLKMVLSPNQRAKYFDTLVSVDHANEGDRRIGYARAMADNGHKEIALDELKDTISSLSAEITETSGHEPALWYVRGRALLLASRLIRPSGTFREAFSEAEKAAESFKRARDGGLDCAGIVSMRISSALVEAARSEAALDETRSAMKWLDSAREALTDSAAKRTDEMPDIELLSARILALKGELFKQRGSFDSAEEFFSAALDDIAGLEKRFGLSNPDAVLFRANIHLSLADLLAKSGSEEAAFNSILDAQKTFERFEEIIGGSVPESWIGRGKASLLKSSILAADNTVDAIDAGREADGYFKHAWKVIPSEEAALGRIDALISIAELLAEENRADMAIFEEIERILADRTKTDGETVPLIKRRIRLYRARGTASYFKGKYTNAARYYASAVKLYSKLYTLAPEVPFAADLAEIHMASAVALRKAAEPQEAFNSLLRAGEAFEIAADNSTKGGLKRVLHSAIGIYNEFASTGMDESAFEIALFILEMVVRVGGTEVLETGQELLTFWESQELSSREKRRLDNAAAPLKEQWGEF